MPAKKYDIKTLDELFTYCVQDSSTGCWIWNGPSDGNGYPRVGHRWRGHRLAWTLANGPIPKGDGYHGECCVCHRCDRPLCCNPDHLFLGSHKDNSDDKVRKGRQARVRGYSKLTVEQVTEMRRLSEQGVTGAELARRFGVQKSTVSYALNGRTWR